MKSQLIAIISILIFSSSSCQSQTTKKMTEQTNPLLYAISSTQNNVKGLLVNAYSVYAVSASIKLIEKLNSR